MKVLLPKVLRDTSAFEWRTTDVRIINHIDYF